MTGKTRIVLGWGALLVLAACNRGPEAMSVLQSPAEFNCFAAVEETAGRGDLTLLALARTASGAEAQILNRRDGAIYTCRTNTDGAITSLRQGLGPAPES